MALLEPGDRRQITGGLKTDRTVEEGRMGITATDGGGAPCPHCSGAGLGAGQSLAGTTSPLTAAIEASRWNRDDVELALTAASVVASVIVVYLTVSGD